MIIKMDKINIGIYIGSVLEKFGYVTPVYVQQKILNDPSSGTVVPLEQIDETLDILVTAGFLELHDGGVDRPGIYKRFVPPNHYKIKIPKAVYG